MANSRSNIYPVQLQGAELNLNKYDAEIKQYSGFNKNNSPFVGGCLSNVFTKEQQIEGGNADNVYIDANGDVYQVTTEGFYRNNEKLIKYNAWTKFINQKEIIEIDSDKNLIKRFSDKVVLYYKASTSIYSGGFDIYLNDYLMAEGVNIEGVNNYKNKTDCIFDFYKDSNNVIHNYFIFHYRGSQRVYIGNSDTGSVLNYKYFGAISITESYISKKAGSPYFAAYVRTASLQDADKIFVYDVINNTSGSVDIPVDLTDFGLNNLLQKRIKQYKVLCNPGNNTTISGFNQNVFVLVPETVDTSASLTANIDVIATLKLTITDLNNINLVADQIIPFAMISAPQRWKNSVDLSSYKINIESNNSSFYTPFVMQIKANYRDAGYNNKDFLWYYNGQCSNLVQYVDEEIVPQGGYIENFMDATSKEGFQLAYNNNALTSIFSFARGYRVDDYDFYNEGIIACTDWLKVEREDVVIIRKGDGISICYKQNDKYYLLYKNNIPKIRKVLNQLISNVDYSYNSFNIDKKSFMHYAVGFNAAFYLRDPIRNSITSGYAFLELDTTLYEKTFACAVNEYDLDKNVSAIFAPVTFITGPLTSTIYFFMSYFVRYDLYKGDTLLDLKYFTTYYYGTSSRYGDKNPKLIDLPYPIQTDGNAILSATLFSEVFVYGNMGIIKQGDTSYNLMKNDNNLILSYYLLSITENVDYVFIIQGQYYCIKNNQIYFMQFSNGVAQDISYVVDITGLQFVGNTPYEALFFSKTNRCLYSFTGANVLNAKQFVDKINEIRNYKYNPATQSIFLITDIGVIVYSLFGIYQIEFLNCQDMYLLNNGVVLTDNEGTFKYVKYYKEETTEDYIKENITLDTCFYGMNNQTVTINDCLYFRIFSEEHEEGDLKVSATTISLSGRKTEETTFKIKASDWDAITHTIYLRYQPKEQRGLGVSFSIDSPFKIASLSVGSQADAILVDKVSKGAINAPQTTSNNAEW